MYKRMWKSLKEIFEIEINSLSNQISPNRFVFTDKYINKLTNESKIKTLKNILSIIERLEKEDEIMNDRTESLLQYMTLEKEKINNELLSIDDHNIEERIKTRTFHSLFSIMLCDIDIKLAKSNNENPWDVIKEYIEVDSKKYESSILKDDYNKIIKELKEKIIELEG